VTTDLAEKVLAVIGGGVGSGLALGLLVQLLLRAMTVRKPPRWSVMVVRLLGGIICGWLVALWLFGGGGPGIGGAGGWGLGSGPGKGQGEKAVENGNKGRDGNKNGDDGKTPPGPTLRIEVLGDKPLSDRGIPKERRYRLDGEQGRPMTFDQVKDAILKRRQDQPSLRHLEIVLYQDSPAEDKLLVSQLKAWAKDPKGGHATVTISKPSVNAPSK
jgi:hypothetical protein